MEINQIQDTLLKLFNSEKKRLIFWYDTEQEFEEIIPSLQLDGVEILHLKELTSLEIKIKLETQDLHGKYLLYAPFAEPLPGQDWLLDIRLYSHTFHADRASIILNDLGLARKSLHSHIKARKKFFNSQKRINRLKKWVQKDDLEDDLDLKMLGVAAKAQAPDVFFILMKLFDSYCTKGGFHPSAQSKVWVEIEKLGLEKPFWFLMAKSYGYASDTPKLTDLLIKLLVTDFINNLKADTPISIAQFVIPDHTNALSASVFLSQWRNDINHFQTYSRISGHFAKDLKINALLQAYEPESLAEAMTFESIERRVISFLKDIVVSGRDEEFERVIENIRKRLDGHWAKTILTASGKENLYKTTYHALETAIELMFLRKEYSSGISFPTAREMFQAYCDDLFRFDQYYRLFHAAADKVELGGWDVLKELQISVEDIYNHWFLDQMALAWDGFLEKPDGGLLEKWQIQGVTPQYRFSTEYVETVQRKSPKTKVYVVVSDAFRYEAAEELMREINGKYRLAAELKLMMGVLPSYTSLGMAALLPHQILSYASNAGVLVDGKSTAGLDQRNTILAENNGVAIRSEDLMAMDKVKGREFVKPHQVIYVYHNQVDAVGDKASTESGTFGAVRKAIDEISAIARFIINSLNGSLVLVTADHGFIYQEKTPDNVDKSVLSDKPPGALVSKKRYIIGNSLGESDKVLKGNTKNTANTETSMEFWLPRGTNRFHFVGGSRFFHGGAMLQEIVIPVITIRELRGREREKSEVHKVGVSLLGSIKKVVTNIHRLKFIQTDVVSERMQPRKLEISLRDGNDLISNVEIVTFESKSSSIEDREKSINLILKPGNFDNKKEYHLILRDPETSIEYDRIPVTIDLAFSRDF